MTNGELQKKLAEFPEDMLIEHVCQTDNGIEYAIIDGIRVKRTDNRILLLVDEWHDALV